MRLLTLAASTALVMGLGGCGVEQAAEEPAGRPVQLAVTPAKFSQAEQRPGDDVTLSMTVTNTGAQAAPGLVVELGGLGETTVADPADEGRERTTPDDLPDAVKRAAWFVDDSPEHSPYSSSNLYPAGALEPGRSRTLRWKLNASQPGDHTLTYRVFSGLTQNQAEATSGTGLEGTVQATILER